MLLWYLKPQVNMITQSVQILMLNRTDDFLKYNITNTKQHTSYSITALLGSILNPKFQKNLELNRKSRHAELNIFCL